MKFLVGILIMAKPFIDMFLLHTNDIGNMTNNLLIANLILDVIPVVWACMTSNQRKDSND